MSSSRRLSWIAAFGAVVLSTTPALAQDRVVGREALDPADEELLGPAVDGRTDAPEDADPRALEDFREPLAPYGSWVDDETYGTVWIPSAGEVGADFYPYSSGGHWELTADGDWLWVSDYRWGHIPFHYGRWVWISGRGWAWIPGRVWAPAWVVWRTGPYGYIGWAPCPPTWYWWGGAAMWLWWPPPAAYVFVETRHVFHHHVHHRHLRDPARARRAAAQTRPQREPARPSARSFDRHRPRSPDLDAIRYDGPAPRRSAVRTPPGLSPTDRRAPALGNAPGLRATPRSGFTPRTPDGRFAPAGRGASSGAPSGARPSGGPARGVSPQEAPQLDRGRPESADAPRPAPRSDGWTSGREPRPGPSPSAPRQDGYRPSGGSNPPPLTPARRSKVTPVAPAPRRAAPAPRRGRR